MRPGNTRSALRRARTRTGERGLALLIVLWIIVSAALIVSSFNATVRTGLSFVGSEVQLAKADALLDAGVEIAAARLIDEDETQRWLPDGGRHVVSFEGADLAISISDGNNLIDLNKADKELLLRFLRPYAGSEAKATWIRDRIVAARGTAGVDKKQATRSSWTDDEDAEEQKANQPLPFIDATQLRQIEGMTAELYQQIVPFITVYSRDGRISPIGAPDEVLLAIPELTSADIDRLRSSARGTDKDREDALADISQQAGAYIADKPGPAYIVTVAVRTSKGHTAAKVCVIAVGVDPSAPYRVLSKRTPGAMRNAKRG